ncbi:TPA: hypothetical protein J1248_004729 [Escherichia coli]|nr:hypothetical protein [Escherichia coli]HAZ3780447.1 hypothetical protein [Escherichia coli]HBA8348297.1 hypothetical protein [Escherichia coli]HBB8658707.1 hypothetical protein [Escherichia coli]
MNRQAECFSCVCDGTARRRPSDRTPVSEWSRKRKGTITGPGHLRPAGCSGHLCSLLTRATSLMVVQELTLEGDDVACDETDG